ncbi:MAG: DUF1499 domain-containing protein [Chloroflexota bacterium]
MRVLIIIGIVLVVLVAANTAWLWITARTMPRPDEVDQGDLPPCPDTDNCVSTETTDGLHAIEPILYDTADEVAIETMLTVLREAPRVEVIRSEGNYIYAEAKSPMMGFVDDIDMLIEAGEVRFRSAARMGTIDLHKNRERMEAIREQFEASLAVAAQDG